jgi:Domain of unknown function (DUF397)
MSAPERDGIVWHPSSYSGSGSACVEVGPALAVTTTAWRAFLATVTP